MLSIGVGKKSTIARISGELSPAEFDRVKDVIMNALDAMAKRLPRRKAAHSYDMLTPTGRLRDRKWKKKSNPQQPLRVIIPTRAGAIIDYFDHIVRESVHVERLDRWPRVVGFVEGVERMIHNHGFRMTPPYGKHTRDTLNHLSKPFVVNDPEFFSYMLSKFPSVTDAKKILEMHKQRIGQRKYNLTLKLLGEWHRHERHAPTEKRKTIEFFARAIKTRDPNLRAYDFYPRVTGWKGQATLPF